MYGKVLIGEAMRLEGPGLYAAFTNLGIAEENISQNQDDLANDFELRQFEKIAIYQNDWYQQLIAKDFSYHQNAKFIIYPKMSMRNFLLINKANEDKKGHIHFTTGVQDMMMQSNFKVGNKI